MRNDYLNVPIPILVYSIRSGRYREIAVWLLLKFITDGHFHMNHRIAKAIQGVLEIKSRQTVTKYIKWLLKKGFLTYNGKRSEYHIISLKQASKRLDKRTYIGLVIYPSDLKEFELYAFSAVIKNIVRRGRKKAKQSGFFMGKPSREL
ncbi:MAG: hypothetical protein R2751_04395 [Bacteroidales bacterium]